MKKIYIGVVVAIILGIIIYMLPKDFKHTYEDVQVYENVQVYEDLEVNGKVHKVKNIEQKKSKKIDIKIDAKIVKERFVWQRLKFSEVLEGKVTIDNKDYYLFSIDKYEFPDEHGNYTDNNIYSAILSTNPKDIRDEVYYFDSTHDKSKLYIKSINDSINAHGSNEVIPCEEFVYPVKSDNDYREIKDIMN